MPRVSTVPTVQRGGFASVLGPCCAPRGDTLRLARLAGPAVWVVLTVLSFSLLCSFSTPPPAARRRAWWRVLYLGMGLVAWFGNERAWQKIKPPRRARTNTPNHQSIPFFLFFFAALFFKSADEPTLWFATFTHHFTTLSLLEKETREKKQDMSRHTEWCVSDCAQHHSHTLHLPRFTPPPLIFSACMVAHGCLLARIK